MLLMIIKNTVNTLHKVQMNHLNSQLCRLTCSQVTKRFDALKTGHVILHSRR